MDAPFVEVKETLKGKRYEFACTLLSRGEGWVVLLYVLQRSSQVAGLHLPEGTVTVAYYWADRPYNVYHWIHPDGTTIAYYVNIADCTRIEPDRLSWRDLAVDVLVTPDGEIRILDEQDLPADLDPAIREYIEGAKRSLLADSHGLVQHISERSSRLLRNHPRPLRSLP